VANFFALQDETESWVKQLMNRLDLVRHDRPIYDFGLQVYLWPRSEVKHLTEDFHGVQINYPEEWPETLVNGDTGWNARGAEGDTVVVGRRLNGQITRDLRKWAVIPLYTVSTLVPGKATKVFGWSSEAALGAGKPMRQFRNNDVVSFVR
jgi:hypothetical protein